MSKNTPVYPSGQRPIAERGLGRGPQRFALRLARIVRIDYEKFVCDVEYMEGSAQMAREVNLSSAYWSPRGFLGAMPVEGALVVLGFNASHHHMAVRPFILAFLGNGVKTGLNFAPFGGSTQRNDPVLADATLEELTRDLEGLYGPIRHKLRKLTPGDIYGTSDKGGELLLDEGVTIEDRANQRVFLDGIKEELNLVYNSLVSHGAGIFSCSGKVERSELSLPPDLTSLDIIPNTDPRFDSLIARGLITSAGVKTPLALSQPLPRALRDNSPQIFVQEPPVEAQSPEDLFLPYLTEDRKELSLYAEFGTPNGITRDYQPFIESVRGTVVGNDPVTDQGKRTYGKILKPVIFSSPYDINGSPRLEPIDSNPFSENDYNASAASLYRMRRPDGLGELFFSHDREGHVFFSIPASGSKASNLGAGRSVEGDLKGSVKLTLGSTKTDRTSLSIDADGGFRITSGTASPTGRSLDYTARGGIYIQSTGTDANGVSYSITTTGDMTTTVNGSIYEEVSGKIFRSSGGDHTISGEKLFFSSGGGGEDHTSTGAQRNIIALAQDNQIGKGRNTVIATPLNASPIADNLEITTGNRQVIFQAPSSDDITFNTSGSVNISSSGALVYSIDAPAGSFNVTIPTTNIDSSLLINLNSPFVRVGGPSATTPIALAPSIDGVIPGIVTQLNELQIWANTVGTALTIPFVNIPVGPFTPSAATRAFGV